jgi:toxin ParE1/3/4
VVKWSNPAKRDLKQIYDFIAKDSKFYAQKVSLELVEKSEKLEIFPEIGRIVPEMGDPKIRELLIYSYRLIYEIFPGKIEVLTLVHCKRHFTKELIDRRMSQ